MDDYHSMGVAGEAVCKSIKTKGEKRGEADRAVRKRMKTKGRFFGCAPIRKGPALFPEAGGRNAGAGADFCVGAFARFWAMGVGAN